MSEAQGGPPPGWPAGPQVGAFGPGQTEVGEVEDLGRPSFPMPLGSPVAAAPLAAIGGVPGTNLPADGGLLLDAGVPHNGPGAPVGATVVDGAVDLSPAPLMPPGFGPAPPLVGRTVVDDPTAPHYVPGGQAAGPPVAPMYVAPPLATPPKGGIPIWVFGGLGALLIGGGLTTYFVAFDATDDAAPPEAVELPDKPKKLKSKKAEEPEPIRAPVPADDTDDADSDEEPDEPATEDPNPGEPAAPPPAAPPPAAPPPKAPPPPTQPSPPPPPPKASPPPPPKASPPPSTGTTKRRRIKIGGG